MNSCFESFTDGNYPFTSVCIEGPFYYDTVEQYCVDNAQGKITDALNCGSIECDANTCCQASCLISRSYDVCTSTQPTLITASTICQEQCGDVMPSNSNIINRIFTTFLDASNNQRNCTNVDCLIPICVSDLLDIGATQPVCASDGKLYESKVEFCTFQVRNTELGLVLCGQNLCLTQTECCYQNCFLNN